MATMFSKDAWLKLSDFWSLNFCLGKIFSFVKILFQNLYSSYTYIFCKSKLQVL